MPIILFVMKYPMGRQENLKRKFDGQMTAARKLGWETYCIGYDEKGMSLLGDGTVEPLRRNPLAKLPGYGHTAIFHDLMAAVQEAFKRHKIDVLYLRYMPTFGNAPAAMRALKAQGGKLVIEYPTYPVAQEKNRFFLRRQVFRYADRVLEKINPMVDLYTAIGAPCGDSLDGRPAMNIVNGVDVDSLPPHQTNAHPEIRLLALASMCGWHGYDRVLRAMAEYRGDADVRLEMIGSDGDGSLKEWRALTEALGLSDRVTFRGPMHGDALNAIVATCDLGVGNLGMFRYNLMRATTLKVREFMARGLPFVTAVFDPTMPDEPDFALNLPNDETPVDMAEIVAFARRAKTDPDLPARMRAYAREHMSWEGVLRGVLEKLG